MKRTLSALILITLVGCSRASQVPTDNADATVIPPTATITPAATESVSTETPTPEPTITSTATPGFTACADTPSDEMVYFTQPGNGVRARTPDMETLELWAIHRDGSDEQLIAEVSPPYLADFDFVLSPDRHFAVASDGSGGRAIDLTGGPTASIREPAAPDRWFSHFVWTVDSRYLYFAEKGEGHNHTIWRASFFALGAPTKLLTAPMTAGDESVGGADVPLYPHITLPDHRLVLIAAEVFYDAAIWDQRTEQLMPLTHPDFSKIYITDVEPRTGRILFVGLPAGTTSGPRSLYEGSIDAAGQVIDTIRLTGAYFGGGSYITEERILAQHFKQPEGTSEYLILTPSGEGKMWDAQPLPDLPDQHILGAEVLDSATLLLTTDAWDLWLHSDDQTCYLTSIREP